MSAMLSEEKVLKKLNIPDFRHLTKGKVIAMASLLDRMNPEVAKKALEQFPEFARTMKEMLSDYRKTLDGILQQNGESNKAYYESCQAVIASLQRQLEDENLSFEDRKYVIEKMMEISSSMEKKNSEDKAFLRSLALIAGGIVLGLAGIAASVLGGNTLIKGNSDTTEDEDSLEDLNDIE